MFSCGCKEEVVRIRNSLSCANANHWCLRRFENFPSLRPLFSSFRVSTMFFSTYGGCSIPTEFLKVVLIFSWPAFLFLQSFDKLCLSSRGPRICPCEVLALCRHLVGQFPVFSEDLKSSFRPRYLDN